MSTIPSAPNLPHDNMIKAAAPPAPYIQEADFLHLPDYTLDSTVRGVDGRSAAGYIIPHHNIALYDLQYSADEDCNHGAGESPAAVVQPSDRTRRITDHRIRKAAHWHLACALAYEYLHSIDSPSQRSRVSKRSSHDPHTRILQDIQRSPNYGTTSVEDHPATDLHVSVADQHYTCMLNRLDSAKHIDGHDPEQYRHSRAAGLPSPTSNAIDDRKASSVDVILNMADIVNPTQASRIWLRDRFLSPAALVS